MWLPYMLQMDSWKYIAIFNLAIEILEGRGIGEQDKQEISVGLRKPWNSRRSPSRELGRSEATTL